MMATDSQKGKGTSSILTFFQGKSLSSAVSDASYDDIQDDAPSSSIGCNRNMLPEADEDQEVFAHEKSVKEDDALSQDRRADELCTKNRKHKNKGNGSIFRFFSGINASSKQVSNAPSSDSKRYQDQDQRDHQEECVANEHHRLDRISNQQRDGSWNFSAEEIDPSVVGELPVEIQQEVRDWIRSSKRIKTTKRGSNIFHYFSKDEDS